MATIQEQVTSWRGSNQDNLLSKLQIDSNLYSIKDPAVDQLATYVDTAIAGVQSQITKATEFTPVSKDSNAGKFATSVTQDATGKITVAYSDIRSEALGNTAAANKIISELTQGVDGQVSYTATDLVASNVGSTAIAKSDTSIGITATNVQSAIAELATGVQSSKADAIAAAEAKVNELAGTDWTTAAGTVQDIIAELKADGSSVANLDTIIDKLRGNFTYGESGSQTTDVKAYIDGKFGELEDAVQDVSVSAEGDDLVNATTSNNGRTVVVGAQSALTTAVGYAKSALQTVTGETGTDALISVSAKDGNDGAKTSAISATPKLTSAVAAAETALQQIDGDTYISVGAKANGVQGISATSTLTTAVTKANDALPAAKVAKDQITYLQSGNYASETLSFTTVTNKGIIIPSGSWGS